MAAKTSAQFDEQLERYHDDVHVMFQDFYREKHVDEPEYTEEEAEQFADFHAQKEIEDIMDAIEKLEDPATAKHAQIDGKVPYWSICERRSDCVPISPMSVA